MHIIYLCIPQWRNENLFRRGGEIIPLNWILYLKKMKFEYNKNTLVVLDTLYLFGIVFN